MVAHSLTRHVRNIIDEMYWLEDFSPPAVYTLYQDFLHINEWTNSLFFKKKEKRKRKKKKSLFVLESLSLSLSLPPKFVFVSHKIFIISDLLYYIKKKVNLTIFFIISWSDYKKLSSRVDTISWNSLKKKKKKIT